jgi:type I restriction enzyme R subunit
VPGIIRPPYNEVRATYNELAASFKVKYPTVQSIDSLQNEHDKIEFVKAFREIVKLHAEIQIYEDYSADDPEFVLTEQEFNDFRSKYLDIVIGPTDEDNNQGQEAAEPEQGYGDPVNMEDIDFCLELLHSDIINVAYILELIADLNPSSEDYEQQRQKILDTMIRDAEMRSKAKLIDGFIRKHVDDDAENFERSKADGTIDLESRLRDYITTERTNAISNLAKDEELPVEVLNKYLSEYDYLQKSKPEIIQTELKKKHLGLLKTRKALQRIIAGLAQIINTFDWE